MMYRISRYLLSVFCRLLFKVTVHKKYEVAAPPAIIVCNHTSLLDPPLVGYALAEYDINFMAKKELFDTPVVGIWMRKVNAIEVKRGNNSIKSIKEAISRLKKGNVVALFPEGTRSETGEIMDPKRGVGFLIEKSKVPIIPCFVEGSSNALPKGKGIKLGTKVDIYVGKVIGVDEYSSLEGEGKERYVNIANYIMDKILNIKSEDFQD